MSADRVAEEIQDALVAKFRKSRDASEVVGSGGAHLQVVGALWRQAAFTGAGRPPLFARRWPEGRGGSAHLLPRLLFQKGFRDENGGQRCSKSKRFTTSACRSATSI